MFSNTFIFLVKPTLARRGLGLEALDPPTSILQPKVESIKKDYTPLPGKWNDNLDKI